MFSPNRKRPDPRIGGSKEPVSMTREAKRRLWATAGLTLLLLVIWYGCMAAALAKAVMIAYFLVFAVLLVTYIAYNRGFVNKDVTAEMLPADWSEEKKQTFLENEKLRVQKSRWMLTVIIPFIIVFMCEALYLFVWDSYLADFFKG